MSRTTDVLIAGGGIAGLAAARALQLKGIDALVLEQRNDPLDKGLAINLPGNAIAALHALGLEEPTRAFGRPVRRREYRTGNGRLLFAVDEQAFWGETLTPRCMRRGDLSDLLGRDLPEETVHRGCMLSGIEEQPESIQVHSAGSEVFEGRILVGADGVNSTVRKLRFETAAPAMARLASASWRFMARNPGVDCWTVWAGAKAMALLIPVSDDEVYGWAAATGEHGQASDPTLLGELLSAFPAPVRQAVDAALANPQRLYYSPLEEVRLDGWSSGRTLLIGDAAHATAPVWAQGAALALEDALVLAEYLAGHPDRSDVAARFERARRSRVAHVQAMTERMSKAARLPTVLRDLLLPFLGPRSYAATYGPLKQPV